ncbi:protein-L-isoaspartate(D-aspartate) O-methyltransferase [Kribbella antiqua]|uniref:Protein-L-isoaspartate O-methyltransferase n=1 Tax=Kribbella antiqua TaxID=2512217 RepID=A0A4R2IXS4_9ACTN|nr:methyltransferase, FxLD system [Kribbella antiqua]TCO50563.1 protein-L-isoaspartate(D-aspartate) O-methyltransferase [Kribbella antiqua]
MDRSPAGSLRAALTHHLIAEGSIRDERVAMAFRAVPRHVFVPGVPLEVAYADDVVLMKRNEAGAPISSVSQPSIVALMLEQAEIRSGDRVLEIGSGGYNAALMRELAGPKGSVTTVDIDPEVTDRARAALAEAGYDDVRVVQADGEFGAPDGAPYDRIVVTVTAWDIAPAWIEQLEPDGRIVVPVRLRGQTRSIAFDKVGDHLESRSATLCGFVCMQGAGANYERLIPIAGDDVGVIFDEDQEAEAHPYDGVLEQSRLRVWSGVVMNREEPLSDLALWLASTLPGYCVLTGAEATPSGGAAAVATCDSLAYVTARPGRRKSFVELGVHGHGPDAGHLVERLVDQLRIWDAHHRYGPGPEFQAHLVGEEAPAGFRIARRHSCFTVSWAGHPGAAGS